MRAHCDNCEQRSWNRGLVYALSYVGCLLALCAHLWFPAFCMDPAKHFEVCHLALSCASALIIDKNAVEWCACCSLLTNVWHHRHVSPTAFSYPESILFSTDEHGWWCWTWMGKERGTVSVCHWVLMYAARVTLYSLSLSLSCVLFLCRFNLNFPRPLTLHSSFSVFLPSSKKGSPAWRGGSLSLSFSLSLTPFFSRSRSFSHSLTGPLNLLISTPNPTPLSLFLSFPCDCDPAQMRVTSEV